MNFPMIETILKGMQARYSRILDTYYPSFGTTGFTERNLTFAFCHEALKQNDRLIVWQEVPLEKKSEHSKSEHLDSIIIDDSNEAVYLIEAKRLGAASALSSIEDDMERLNKISTNWMCIRGVEDSYAPARKSYHKYLIILVDLWADHDSSEESVKTEKSYWSFVKKTAEKGFNQIYGPYKVDGKRLDNQKYYLMCAVKTI